MTSNSGYILVCTSKNYVSRGGEALVLRASYVVCGTGLKKKKYNKSVIQGRRVFLMKNTYFRENFIFETGL